MERKWGMGMDWVGWLGFRGEERRGGGGEESKNQKIEKVRDER